MKVFAALIESRPGSINYGIYLFSTIHSMKLGFFLLQLLHLNTKT